ncbi:MAG: hypothetical protein V4857_28420 [Pseudomonadota bacterium]
MSVRLSARPLIIAVLIITTTLPWARAGVGLTLQDRIEEANRKQAEADRARYAAQAKTRHAREQARNEAAAQRRSSRESQPSRSSNRTVK